MLLFLFVAAWSRSEGGQEVWVKAEPGRTPTRDVGGRGWVYRWEAWGKEWAVQVWPDAGFLAPTMLIRHEADHHATVTRPTSHARCFHTGVLLGATDSAVALNTCNGLVSTQVSLVLLCCMGRPCLSCVAWRQPLVLSVDGRRRGRRQSTRDPWEGRGLCSSGEGPMEWWCRRTTVSLESVVGMR